MPEPSPASARHRESTLVSWLSDLRYSLRSLGRRPAWALTAIVLLTLGIGANVALFTVTHAVLFQSYPNEDPERLFVLNCHPQDAPARGSCAWPDVVDLRERLDGRVDLVPWDWEPASLVGGDRPQRIGTAMVTENFASVLGVPLLSGRWFSGEEQLRSATVGVISERLWRDGFGSDPAILGRVVQIDGYDFAIVGVAPGELNAISDVDFFLPMRPGGAGRDSHWLGVFARAGTQLAPETAQVQVREVMGQLAEEYPDSNGQKTATLVPLREARTGDQRPALMALSAVGLVLLLVVCASVANLLLFRTTTRREEIGLRYALGADRLRLIRMLVCDSLVVCAIGLLGGLMLGLWAVSSSSQWLPDEAIPPWVRFEVDPVVLVFAAGLAAVCALAASIAPGLRQARLLQDVSAGARSGGASRGSMRFSRWLVVAEVSCTVLLLIIAGLLLRDLLDLSSRDAGLQREEAVVLGLDLLSLRRDPDLKQRRFAEYLEEFGRVPGVAAVGAIDRIPLGGGRNRSGVTPRESDGRRYDPMVTVSRVTPGLRAALGIPLLAGRDFDERTFLGQLAESEEPTEPEQGVDAVAAAPLELLISHSLAEAIWPDRPAVGQQLKFARPDDEAPWWTVIGVVGDVTHRDVSEQGVQSVYMVDRALGMTRASWVVRGAGADQALIDALRQRVATIDPTQPLWGVRTLADHVADSLWLQRLMARLLTAFALLTACIAMLGLYSVMAYASSRRQFEMGVRLALGSDAGSVFRLMIGEAVRLTVVGILIGIGLGVAAAPMIGRLTGIAHRVPEAGLVAGAVAAVLLAAVAASALPALRAARCRPTEILLGAQE